MDLLRSVLFLPRGASTIADSLDLLHGFIITLTMIGAAGIFIVAIAFTFKYRRRSDQEYTPTVRPPLWYEVFVIGGLLSLFLIWWVIGIRQYTEMHEVPEDAEEIYVTGKQWMWKFAHPEGRSSVGVLVVPVDRPVRLILTSRDVIHSFFVPAFRIKQDAVPGRFTSISFEVNQAGTFRAFCTEYCGEAHSRMWATVVALGARDYATWLDGSTPEPVAEAQQEANIRPKRFAQLGRTSMVEEGREAATRYGCLNCHTVDGQAHIGPSWLGLYGSQRRLQTGERTEADEDYLTESMMMPEAKRVAGYELVMPTYKGVLSGPETAAIVEYIKSLAELEPRPTVRLPRVDPREEGQPQWRPDGGPGPRAAPPGNPGRQDAGGGGGDG